MKSLAEQWAATTGKFLRWKMSEAASQRDWDAVVSVSPDLTFWLGADGAKDGK